MIINWCHIYIFEVSDIENFNANYKLNSKNILLNYVKNLEINTNKNGKPYLKNEQNIYFNKSKRTPYFAIAIGNFEIGIDLELLEHEKILMASKSKNDLFENIHSIEDWVLQEAVIKSYGGQIDDLFKLQAIDKNLWQINSSIITCKIITISSTYKIALAYDNNISAVEIKISSKII
jgi:phosphopantetheinyl transferase